jgi:hypothetical protein
VSSRKPERAEKEKKRASERAKAREGEAARRGTRGGRAQEKERKLSDRRFHGEGKESPGKTDKARRR